MTKQTFLKRLKKMLIRYPDDACGHCPAQPFYQIGGPPIEGGLDTHDLCRLIMDIRFDCPCTTLGPQKAIARAWEVINAYEKEHGSLT